MGGPEWLDEHWDQRARHIEGAADLWLGIWLAWYCSNCCLARYHETSGDYEVALAIDERK